MAARMERQERSESVYLKRIKYISTENFRALNQDAIIRSQEKTVIRLQTSAYVPEKIFVKQLLQHAKRNQAGQAVLHITGARSFTVLQRCSKHGVRSLLAN